MIKDINQKIKAIRYCVALGMVPFMEVVVRFSSEVSDVPSDITDIDVLGVKPGGESPSQRIIFDCKTLNKMSPINRALWANGLISLTKSDEAFVILSKSAPDGHRLAGNSIGVRLFTEGLFDSYAKSSSSYYSVQNSYIESLSGWEALAELPSRYPALQELWWLLNSTCVLEKNPRQGLRNLMAACRRYEGEFDPEKKIHQALYKLILVQIGLYVSEMVRDFHNIFFSDMSKSDFEKILRNYVWDGKDNYAVRQKLNMAIKMGKGAEEIDNFELPGWDVFVDVFRSFLDSPLQFGVVCLPLKDLAFRDVSVIDPILEKRIGHRLDANDRVRQYILSLSRYLIAATRIPRAFSDKLKSDVLSIVSV
jgi:hypothetical protein